MIMTMGNLNAMSVTLATGQFGLGIMNEAGKRVKDFCTEHELVVATTLFKQHPRRKYT